MADIDYKDVIALCGCVSINKGNSLYFRSDYAIIYNENNKLELKNVKDIEGKFEQILITSSEDKQIFNSNDPQLGDSADKAKQELSGDNAYNYCAIPIRYLLIPFKEEDEDFHKRYHDYYYYQITKYNFKSNYRQYYSQMSLDLKKYIKNKTSGGKNDDGEQLLCNFIDSYILPDLSNLLEPLINKIGELNSKCEALCLEKDRLANYNTDLEELDNKIRDEILSENDLDKDLQRLKELADNSYIARIFAEKQEEVKAVCDKDKEKDKYEKAEVSVEIEKRTETDKALVDNIVNDIENFRKYDNYKFFFQNVLICIAQNFITVFAGQPGTGKTSLCDIIAGALGLDKLRYDALDISRYISVSVERGWNSKSELIGYYNALSKEHEDSGNGLYHALKLLDKELDKELENKKKNENAYPFFVLLDEANLSPVEHYWSAFMKLADESELHKDYRGEIAIGGGEKFRVPDQLRFLATVNNDLTTEPLSPRLLDRTSVIKLPEVDFNGSVSELQITDKSVSWSDFKAAFLPQNASQLPNDDNNKIVGYKKDNTAPNNQQSRQSEKLLPSEFLKEVYSIFKEAKMPVSIRIKNRIAQYIEAAVELGMPIYTALDYAVAQNLLPKINGYYEEYAKFIDELSGFVGYTEYAAKVNKTSEDKKFPLLYDTLEAFKEAKENNEYISYLSL